MKKTMNKRNIATRQKRGTDSTTSQREDRKPSALWLRQRLRRWYQEHRRAFRWRTYPRDPYVVLVAEVMLQQTQVWRVEPALERFLERFPTLEHLARASRRDVLLSWQGLGYNRRALYLHESARVIVATFGGVVPSDVSQLRKLPGIGDYTACAIAAFAYGKDVAVVDVNIQRVLGRVFFPLRTEGALIPIGIVRRYAEQLLPRGGGRWWNEALMDFGSLVCTKRSPRCTECPLRRHCASAGKLRPAKQQSKEEPCYRNLPRRLWRGRLLELLRQRSYCTVAECAALLFGSTAAEDIAWLRTVADQMASDGVLCRDGERLELPA